jgi:hypothetical protein
MFCGPDYLVETEAYHRKLLLGVIKPSKKNEMSSRHAERTIIMKCKRIMRLEITTHANISTLCKMSFPQSC